MVDEKGRGRGVVDESGRGKKLDEGAVDGNEKIGEKLIR